MPTRRAQEMAEQERYMLLDGMAHYNMAASLLRRARNQLFFQPDRGYPPIPDELRARTLTVLQEIERIADEIDGIIFPRVVTPPAQEEGRHEDE